jgi:hypothetical protein
VSNVVKLLSKEDQDQKRIGDLLKELNDAYEKGNVSELMFGYIEADGSSCYAVSGNMKCSSLAYLISVFQWKLNKWIDASP